MEINDKLLDELLAQAGTNERRRINLDLRNGEGDTSQRIPAGQCRCPGI